MSAVQVILTLLVMPLSIETLSLFNDFGLMLFMSKVRSPELGVQLPGAIVPVTLILKLGAAAGAVWARAPVLAAQATRAAKSLLVWCFISV